MMVAKKAAKAGKATVVEASEITQAYYERGASLTAVGRKVFVMLLAKAAGDAADDKKHAITAAELRKIHERGPGRGGHGSNDRLKAALKELLAVRINAVCPSPRGVGGGWEAAPILDFVHVEKEGQGSLVWFRFSETMRKVMAASETYAEIEQAAIYAVQSKYAVSLLKLGCLFYKRQHPVWRGTVEQLRQVLGVPDGKYRDWTDLRRKTLQAAQPELDQLAPFAFEFEEIEYVGRSVRTVELRFFLKAGGQEARTARELDVVKLGRKVRRAENNSEQLRDDDLFLRVVPPSAALAILVDDDGTANDRS